jgi:C-terminal processing protease CtpA/Prc
MLDGSSARRVALPLAALVAASTAARPARAQAAAPAKAAPAIAPAARAYLSAALDTLERLAMRRATTDWRAVRDGAFARAAGAQTPADTYGAIEWALRRVDKHSFLQPRRGDVRATLVDGRFGYFRVPSYSGPGMAPLADSLQAAIRTLEGQGACGWIVDLRGNGGGNVWPMQAGIGPLLGDSVISAAAPGDPPGRSVYVDGAAIEVGPDGTRQVISRVQQPYVVRRPGAPVALLLDRHTASSAEGIAIAFRPRPDTRTFGEPTAGYSTVNRGSALPDGANMVITVRAMTDRTGRRYGEALVPDERVATPEDHWPTSSDVVARRAAQWLAAHPGCAAGVRP